MSEFHNPPKKVSPYYHINTFRSCYEKLYNTVDSSAELGVVKTNIQTSIKSNIQASLNEANKITPEVVRSAAELLKPDKSDVSSAQMCSNTHLRSSTTTSRPYSGRMWYMAVLPKKFLSAHFCL